MTSLMLFTAQKNQTLINTKLLGFISEPAVKRGKTTHILAGREMQCIRKIHTVRKPGQRILNCFRVNNKNVAQP